MADILERELVEYQPLKVSGKVKETYQSVIDQFNTDQNKKILIMTSAGQFGLNVQDYLQPEPSLLEVLEPSLADHLYRGE